MFKEYYVYILTNNSKTLYIGVTSDLAVRVFQHRGHQVPGFSARYRMHRLIYFEIFSNIYEAIIREKQLKGWNRAKKIALIETQNPDWQDLGDKLIA